MNAALTLPVSFNLQSYADSARHLHENIEAYGRARAEEIYRDLLAQQEGTNSYAAAWADAFGGPGPAHGAVLLAERVDA